MTRAERITAAAQAAEDAEENDPLTGVWAAALDAALADLGGLDGLDTLSQRVEAGDDYADHLAGRTTAQAQEIDALRADRDRLPDELRDALAERCWREMRRLREDRYRLREALRALTVEQRTEGFDSARERGRAALRESEAGS